MLHRIVISPQGQLGFKAHFEPDLASAKKSLGGTNLEAELTTAYDESLTAGLKPKAKARRSD